MEAKDISGQKFGRLTAIKYISSSKPEVPFWLFKCSCGNEKKLLKYNVTQGKTKSCGCLNIENTIKRSTTHGESCTRFYRTWCHMKSRFKDKKYNDRGRIIHTSKRWQKFKNFKDDMYESYLFHVEKFGERQTTIDRINTDGNYCKENCRWATFKEQALNTRRSPTLNNSRIDVENCAKKYGMKKSLIYSRIRKKYPIEKLFLPPNQKPTRIYIRRDTQKI